MNVDFIKAFVIPNNVGRDKNGNFMVTDSIWQEIGSRKHRLTVACSRILRHLTNLSLIRVTFTDKCPLQSLAS